MTATSQSPAPQPTLKVRDTFRHDVKAQIVNITCLASFVETAVDSLEPMIQTGNTGDNLLASDANLVVIRDDILPFVRMIVEASNTLDTIVGNEDRTSRRDEPE